MSCSMPGLPVHHQLPEPTQTHVHWVSDAIPPSNPLSSPSPALNLSQHQGLFKWVSSSHQVAKVWSFSFNISLPMNTQDWSPLGWTGLISSQSKGLSRVFSNTQFKSINSLVLGFLYSPSHPYMTTEKTKALTRQTFAGKVMSLLLNMLSSFVITFLPKSKHVLISWQQSPSAVILETKYIKGTGM